MKILSNNYHTGVKGVKTVKGYSNSTQAHYEVEDSEEGVHTGSPKIFLFRRVK